MYRRNSKTYAIYLAALITTIPLISVAEQYAPVTGNVEEVFTGRKAVPETEITILETGRTFPTNEKGQFGPFRYPVGKPLTLVAKKCGFRTMQSATVEVPPEGLTGAHTMTMEMFEESLFYLTSLAMDTWPDETKCHVVIGVTGYKKTLDDQPHGEAGATVSLIPSTTETPYYLDTYNGNINPFTKGLKETTAVGDVVYANVEPSNTPYTVVTTKNGVTFDQVKFMCRPGIFIHLNWPHGPTAQN